MEAMFLGQFRGRIDAQRAFHLPPSLCAHLAAGMVVTRGLDKCLMLFPREAWQELAHKVCRLPITLPPARALRRLLFAGALHCLADGECHITLSEELCAYAQIEGQLILVGLGTYLEIWSPASWGNTLLHVEAEAGSSAEELAV